MRSETIPSATRQESVALSTWLAMLGWQVEIEQDGAVYAGVARHITGDGNNVTVGGCASSQSETVWQLFEAAIDRLGASTR